MYMHIRKMIFFLVILTGFIIGFWCMPFSTSEQMKSSRQTTMYESEIKSPESIPKIATGDNYQAIDDMFSAKLNEYSTNGFFNQIYEPSLQATYYALYILKALDMIDSVDKIAISNYIMSYYNTTTRIFTDDYAYRYMDTDPNNPYYPFTTLLEVNCYAVLSLALLDQLPSLDIQRDIINFILSCYHPDIHGFIGQPYGDCPSGTLKIPTMDNTYYALITLDVLNVDLGTRRLDTLGYIKDLQDLVWGFKNDDDDYFRSLGVTMLEPNLLSAYYCIKSLDLYNYADSINTDKFHEYLNTLYDDQNFIFQLLFFHLADKDNIIASALGLQLSDLTPLLGKSFLDSENRSGVINFILSNRNSIGNWDSSTPYEFHELFNTFLIIRSLNETGAISQLTAADKNEIFDSLSYYNSSGGYCLLSSDYASMEQYYNVINSFYLYEKDGELDQSGIYNILKETCLYEADFSTYYFYACTNIPVQEFVAGEPAVPGSGFHSYPIEYFTMGNREYLKKWNRVDDHKAKYQVLDSLDKILMLSNLDLECDLNAMLDNVVNSQFLETGYSNKGGFLPTITLSSLSYPYSYQNSEIILEHSYYAVKCMELLTDYLNLGPITDLNFDTTLLHNYIINDIVNDANFCYYNPQYSDNIETILENTYNMIYILKAIDLYSQDDQKIKNYVLQNLNYSNIKNVYYSYKISEILDLDISFDVDKTHTLIQDIYSEELHEFYLTTDRKTIEQQAFSWICEMAKNDKVRIDSDYSDPVMIGDYNTITVSLCNIILTDFGPYTTVKYESSQLGTIVLDSLPDNTFETDVYIPVSKDNYPQINGYIGIYEGIVLVEQIPISFQTTYGLTKDYGFISHSSGVYSEVNITLLSATDSHPLHDSLVYAEIYNNELKIESKNFAAQHIETEGYSLFTLNYSSTNGGEYVMKLFLDNPYETTTEFLTETQFSITAYVSESKGESTSDEGEKEATLTANYQGAIPIMIAIIVIPSCVIGISTKLKKKTILNSRTN